MYKYLIIPAIFLFMLSCSDTGTNPTVLRSETWRLNDVGTQSYADLTLSKLSSGANSALGSWYYDFYGSTVTCKFMNGTAIKTASNDSMVINASGTASYPPDSKGIVESSGFNLLMRGLFANRSSSGTWEIHFTDTLWNGYVNPGRFTGTLQSGSGVTIPDSQ